MDLVQQLQSGLILTVLGMGTVVLFLTLLIFTTKLISKLCLKIAPAKAPVAKAAVQSSPAATAATKDAEIAAAIATAYKKHNN